MLPGKRTNDGALFIAQGPPPAGTPLVGGIAVSHTGVIYVSQAFVQPFSPADLFKQGEQGAWYDPSDFSSMFQDSAGTTPVTAVGQPLGKIIDKSGRENHATQATSARRPVLRQDGNGKYYLEFDGVDDRLDVPTSVFTGVTQATAFYGAYYTAASGSNGAVLQGFGSTSSQGHEPYTGGDFYCNFANSTRPMIGNVPIGSNLVTTLKQSSLNLNYRRNAVDITTVSTAFSKGTVFGIGASSSFGAGWNGRLYSVIIRGALSTTQEITDTETWVAGKTGVTL